MGKTGHMRHFWSYDISHRVDLRDKQRQLQRTEFYSLVARRHLKTLCTPQNLFTAANLLFELPL